MVIGSYVSYAPKLELCNVWGTNAAVLVIGVANTQAYPLAFAKLCKRLKLYN